MRLKRPYDKKSVQGNQETPSLIAIRSRMPGKSITVPKSRQHCAVDVASTLSSRTEAQKTQNPQSPYTTREYANLLRD